MDVINLNGKWNLYYHLEEEDSPSSIGEVKLRNWDKIDAIVPGNIEIDLFNSGIEPDPFYMENLYCYSKYEYFQWWFEREFLITENFAGKNLQLIINGINTYGTIWINDIRVGETDNMLIGYIFDISNAVNIGKTNHIYVRIKSPLCMVRNNEFPINIKGGGNHTDEMVRLRMPPHSFGWDIAPRFLSAGIWRNIEITTRKNTYIKSVYYATQYIKDNKASLLVKYRFSTDIVPIDDFMIHIRGVCGDHTFYTEVPTDFISGETTIIITSPCLWWPIGYGKQNLYKVTLDLVYRGKILDTHSEKIGIRVVEIEAKYLSRFDSEFIIKVNNIPILAKGSNWVPLDAFHSRDTQRLHYTHNLFVDLGCNIIRCWGGNVYEDHEFFDLCDENGLLVWQDFALACGIYPQDDEFATQIEKEASWIVKKLRNHTCIILWSGGNETDEVYLWNEYRLPTARYNRISREILPKVIGSHDPFRFYLPSSPFLPEKITDGESAPEQHIWGSRDYYKSDFYKHNTAHFISEIGYHGCPAVSSIKKFISPKNLWPYKNNEWLTHSTDYIRIEKRVLFRNETMVNQVRMLFGYTPASLLEFALLSQISQAEALKYFIEMTRLKKWRKTGVIWWNVIDCWPQFSDAVVDYFYTRKIAYYYIRRVQHPVCIMMTESEQWNHKVIIGNDSCQDFLIKYTVEDGDTGIIILNGEKLSMANENIEIGSIKSITGLQKLYLMKWEINGTEYGNHYISGYVPINIKHYKRWLKKICLLPKSFNFVNCIESVEK